MKTITQHMKLNQKQRQAHIDLSSPCISQTGKSLSGGKKQAKKELIRYHKIENFMGNTVKVHTCHLCSNNSTAPNGFVCTNPKHTYFGTVSENHMDKTPEQRKAGGKIGGKTGGAKGSRAALKNGNHISQNPLACSENSKKGNKVNGAKAASKSALKNGNHMNQQKRTCIYCGYESTPGVIGRWHNDNCKYKV